MATRSIWRPTLVLLVVTAGVGGLNFHRSSQRSSAERAVAAERTQLQAERQQAEKRLNDAERERSQLQSDLAARTKLNARTPDRPPGMPPRPAPDPAQLAAQAKQAQAQMTLKYAPFYRAAGIDAATATRFEAALREHEAQQRDLWDIARELPPADRTEVVLAPDGTEADRVDPAIAAMRRRMAAQWEAEQIALFGEERYRRLQDYQRDEGKRQVVEQLVGDLTLTEAPLTPEQTRQVTAILAAVDLAEKMSPDEKQWPAILARASQVLTAPQLATLKKQAEKAERMAAQNAFSKLLREQGN